MHNKFKYVSYNPQGVLIANRVFFSYFYPKIKLSYLQSHFLIFLDFFSRISCCRLTNVLLSYLNIEGVLQDVLKLISFAVYLQQNSHKYKI